MRFSPIKLFQLILGAGTLIFLMLMLTNDSTDVVPSRGGAGSDVLSSLKRLIASNYTGHSRWDPLNVFGADTIDAAPSQNVVFSPE